MGATYEESGSEQRASTTSLSISNELLSQADQILPGFSETSSGQEKTSKWNTTNLGLRFGADAASAATASVLVAPVICVIDRYGLPQPSTISTDNSKFNHHQGFHREIIPFMPRTVCPTSSAQSAYISRLEAFPSNLRPLLCHLHHGQYR